MVLGLVRGPRLRSETPAECVRMCTRVCARVCIGACALLIGDGLRGGDGPESLRSEHLMERAAVVVEG